MVYPEYTRISTDSISDDSSIIDFNNTNTNTNHNRNILNNNNNNFEDVDNILLNNNIPLLDTSNSRPARIESILPFINSSSLRNAITKKLYWNMFVIIVITVIPYTLTIYSFVEMQNSHGIDIYNLSSKYMYYYFFILMIFYTFYIGISFIILFLTFCLNLNDNTIRFVLLSNNMIFQTNMIIRIIVIVILAVRMIDNTPMNTIIIDKTNPPAYLDIYIPKHVQYMFIENIIYAFVNYLIGESSGMIKMITTY
jgi:hypothetical protein